MQEPEAGLEPGVHLDRYELLAVLAQGGMGAVWLARLVGKHGFEKLIALKTILPELSGDPKFRAMFLDEARIASRIHHSNVAQVLDLGEQRGVLYQVLEWVDGDSLKTVFRLAEEKRERVPIGVVVRVVADACAGLHAAHELADEHGHLLDVVHRDVSPHNILVSVTGETKVTDFGIAKARGRMAGNTTGTIRGKIHYMAPEQARGDALDRRADVWGLGAVLYEGLAGAKPYEGSSEVATLTQLLTGPPPFVFEQDVPHAVVQIVRRALARSPGARFATAKEMQRELEAAARRAGLWAEVAEVAAYVSSRLAARNAARRDQVERSLRAAQQRGSAPRLSTREGTQPPDGAAVDVDEATTLMRPAANVASGLAAGSAPGSATVPPATRDATSTAALAARRTAERRRMGTALAILVAGAMFGGGAVALRRSIADPPLRVVEVPLNSPREPDGASKREVDGSVPTIGAGTLDASAARTFLPLAVGSGAPEELGGHHGAGRDGSRAGRPLRRAPTLTSPVPPAVPGKHPVDDDDGF